MIHRARILVTVLFDDVDVRPEYFHRASLDSIERLMNQEAIGSLAIEAIEPVDPDTLRQTLLDLGNDGTFFDGFDEPEQPESSKDTGNDIDDNADQDT